MTVDLIHTGILQGLILAIIAFGIILAVGKYQYEHDLKHRQVSKIVEEIKALMLLAFAIVLLYGYMRKKKHRKNNKTHSAQRSVFTFTKIRSHKGVFMTPLWDSYVI